MRIEDLLDKKSLFVTGKGGVGKSSVAAALAAALARSGKRTILVETDTYSAAADLFGVEMPDSEIVSIRERLDGINLDADEAFVETVKRFLPSDRVVRALVKNRVARVFFNSAPSVNEYVLLDQVMSYSSSEDASRLGIEPYEHVVVDLPASGHAVTFLNVPATLQRMIRVGPVAELGGRMAERITDPDETAIVAVCLPEEMPVNETIELSENFDETLGRPLDMVFVNMVHGAPLEPEQRAAFETLRTEVDGTPSSAAGDPIDRLIFGNALALDWYDRDRRYRRLLRDRFSEAKLVELPMFYRRSGSKVIEDMISYLCGDADDADALPPVGDLDEESGDGETLAS